MLKRIYFFILNNKKKIKNFFITLNIFFILVMPECSSVKLCSLFYKYLIISTTLYIIIRIVLFTKNNLNNEFLNTKVSSFFIILFLVFFIIECYMIFLLIAYCAKHPFTFDYHYYFYRKPSQDYGNVWVFNKRLQMVVGYTYYITNELISEYDSMVYSYFINQNIPLLISIILCYNLIFFKKNNKKILCIFIYIFILLTYAVYVDFNKFIYITNLLSNSLASTNLHFFFTNNDFFSIFNEDKNVWYLVTVYLLKFWHLTCIYIYILYIFRCFFFNKSIGYKKLQYCIYNLLMLAFLNTIMYSLWLYLSIFKVYLEMPLFFEIEGVIEYIRCVEYFIDDIITELLLIIYHITPLFDILLTVIAVTERLADTVVDFAIDNHILIILMCICTVLILYTNIRYVVKIALPCLIILIYYLIKLKIALSCLIILIYYLILYSI